MGDFFQMQTNDSVRQEEDISLNLYTNPSTTQPLQHHQISQTIFWCLNDHTTSDDDDDMNREIIDISDEEDEQEKDKNESQNGSILCFDDNEIEVIELLDDGEDEVSDETSDENDHEIHELKTCDEPLDLTNRTNKSTHVQQQQQSTDFEHPSAPTTTSQAEHQPMLCPGDEDDDEENNTNGIAQSAAHKLFSCPVDSCDFVCRTFFQLNHHQLTHTGLRPFRCTWPGCGFTESYRANLLQHIRVKHFHIPTITKKDEAQGNIQCDLEPYQFVDEIFFET